MGGCHDPAEWLGEFQTVAIEVAFEGRKEMYVFQGELVRVFLIVSYPSTIQTPEERRAFRERWEYFSQSLQVDVQLHVDSFVSESVGSLVFQRGSNVSLETNCRTGPSSTSERKGSSNQLIVAGQDVLEQFDTKDQVILLLEALISVNPTFLNQELEFQVVAQPMAQVENYFNSNDLEIVLDPNQLHRIWKSSQKPKPRILKRIVKVVQPLSIEFQTKQIQNAVYITIQVQNTHEELAVSVEDLHFHLNSSQRLNSSTSDPVIFTTYFQSVIEHADLPVKLLPGEQYNFILCIQVKVPDSEDWRRIPGGVFCTLLTLSWRHTELMSTGPVVDQHLIQWTAPHGFERDLFLSITGPSPVPARKVFSVCLTIVNASQVTRDLTVLMPTSNALQYQSEDKSATELLRAVAHETEVEPNVVALTGTVHLGKMAVNSTLCVNLHFFPLQPGKTLLNNVYLYDSISDKYFKLEEEWEIHVTAAEDK